MNKSYSIYIINLYIYPNPSPGLPKREIEEILEAQQDTRTWTTKEGYKPFPTPMKKKDP